MYAKRFHQFFYLHVPEEENFTSVHRFTFCVRLQTKLAPFCHYWTHEERFNVHIAIVFSLSTDGHGHS